jgi:hypothetical protein
MSLREYKRRGKPALWLSVAGAKPVRGPVRVTTPSPVRTQRISPVSKIRRSEMAEYRKEAQAFVREVVSRGETCPVVEAVEELKNGRRYGCPVSAKLNEVHHKFGRCGKLLLWKPGWLCLSKAGHRWVHQNIEKARECGWICGRGDWNSQKVVVG